MEDQSSNPFPSRQRPARQPIFCTGNLSVIVFLTVCTKNRKKILANQGAMDLLVSSWKKANFWLVGRFVIMPDHIHLFASPATFPEYPFKKWMDFWKRDVSKEWKVPEELPLWQKDGWDTQLRRGESYSRKWEYVRSNPVRHGLVSRAEDWPYQGELNVLQWHDA